MRFCKARERAVFMKGAIVARQALLMKQGEGESLKVMGVDVRFLCDSGQTGQAWSLMENILPKDSGPPLHEHPWDEAYYVVEGRVRFMLGSESEVLGAGDFIYAPAGTHHGFQGVSDQPARLLILDVPAHSESFFREVNREVKELPRDLAKVPQIGERHQIRFVHPTA
jgi:quercetin dioxygenase-like cupin family protein